MTEYKALEPLKAMCGSMKPRVVLLGEAWGATEAQYKTPFAGESGKELFRILGDALPDIEPELHARIASWHRDGDVWLKYRQEWFEAAGITLLNTLNFRPPNNQLEPLCLARNELPKGYNLPAIVGAAKFLHPAFIDELTRLKEEIRILKPNVVVALGNTASWAMLGRTTISLIRGALDWSESFGVKCLPTYHPAMILRQWNHRPTVVADLMKARRHSQKPEFVRPVRRVLIDPTYSEIAKWTDETLGMKDIKLGVDIETKNQLITCIGFARSRSNALVIPWVDPAKLGNNYWSSPEDELKVRWQVRRLLESPIPKIFQNGVYDLQYLFKDGYRVNKCLEDTMLLHHSIFPELPKGLGFLGSVYTDEPAWKLMRKPKNEAEKKDE